MTKKYILKPGKHQFAPGEAATHCNENLTDDEARWYLEEYPQIRPLFLHVPIEEEDFADADDLDLFEELY